MTTTPVEQPDGEAVLWMRPPSHFSAACPPTDRGPPLWAPSPPMSRRARFVNMMRHGPGQRRFHFFYLFFKARCLFKVRTCAAPAADAAVLGLFSVKQTGLLAFKPALRSLHPPHPPSSRPREEIETIFRQIAPAFLIRPIIKGKKDELSRVTQPILPPHSG